MPDSVSNVTTPSVAAPTPATPMPVEWIDRYLRLLGVEREVPSRDGLARLTTAHLLAVPFESVTSVLRRRAHPDGAVPSLDPGALLTAWEERRSAILPL